ncbi:MAG: hypothetical protein WCK78_15445 [Paludibacter sp.]
MQGVWSLMGGFVNQFESINDADKRVVEEFTGIEDIYMGWVKITKLPELIFENLLMVKNTLNLQQRQAAIKPIGFNLLQEQFNSPTLQCLYESIYQEDIDNGISEKRFYQWISLKNWMKKIKVLPEKVRFITDSSNRNTIS